MKSGGDVLASGRAGHAQFAGASADITEFENDFIYMSVEEVTNKYGLSQSEYDQYAAQRLEGVKLPDLTSTELQEGMDVGFAVTDHRQNYLSEPLTPAAAVAAAARNFPEPEYEPVQTLMDRILVMVVSDDPNVELLEDGSTRDKSTGLIQTARYRQHSNVGIVLLAGQWVVMGGVKIPMSEIVTPGSKVVFGDYGSEKFPLNDKKAKALCDSLGVNYEKTEQGMRIVRVQDIRTVEHRAVTNG
jgi:hypothetical protein